jgi:hypothetical protein
MLETDRAVIVPNPAYHFVAGFEGVRVMGVDGDLELFLVWSLTTKVPMKCRGSRWTSWDHRLVPYPGLAAQGFASQSRIAGAMLAVSCRRSKSVGGAGSAEYATRGCHRTNRGTMLMAAPNRPHYGTVSSDAYPRCGNRSLAVRTYWAPIRHRQ